MAFVQEWRFWCVQYMSLPHLLPPSIFCSGSPPEACARRGTSFRCPHLPTAVQACNFVKSAILRKDSWRPTLNMSTKNFRAWIRATIAVQASLFFALKRAENIASRAPWPGSNFTWVHQLGSMEPALPFQKCVHSSNRDFKKTILTI